MANAPENMPPDFESALEYLMGVTAPNTNDFKIMAYVEAGGEAFYRGLAEAAPNAEVAELFNKNASEERAHAHRCKRVVEKLSGEAFDVPPNEDNPYYVMPQGVEVNNELLESLIEAEHGGDVLYQGWAENVGDDECARWLSQNGQEEIRHADRCKQAMALL